MVGTPKGVGVAVGVTVGVGDEVGVGVGVLVGVGVFLGLLLAANTCGCFVARHLRDNALIALIR